MKLRNLLILAAFICISSSCAEVTAVNPTGDATYRLTFQGIWTQNDHGTVPGNAHFTTIIGMTHNSSVTLFAPLSPASAGVEEVAETGGTSTLSDEIDVILNAGNAFSKVVVAVSTGPTGSGSAEFTVSEDRPFLSVISMIAPSPDWFVGIRDFELHDNDVWVDDVTFNIGMYDSGTEDGDQFSLDNPETSPRGVITVLDETNASSLSNGTTGIEPIATVRIQKVN